MSTNPDTPGLIAAINALQAIRQEWGLKTLIAFWETPHGEAQAVFDTDGYDLFIDGKPVPRVQ